MDRILLPQRLAIAVFRGFPVSFAETRTGALEAVNSLDCCLVCLDPNSAYHFEFERTPGYGITDGILGDFARPGGYGTVDPLEWHSMGSDAGDDLPNTGDGINIFYAGVGMDFVNGAREYDTLILASKVALNCGDTPDLITDTAADDAVHAGDGDAWTKQGRHRARPAWLC